MLLRQLRGHKGRVNCVAVHPSGKLALSVGKDRTLRMWDLMRGKGSASVKLGKEGELVRWSVKGDRFVVQTGSSIDIYTTASSLSSSFFAAIIDIFRTGYVASSYDYSWFTNSRHTILSTSHRLNCFGR